jgi:hypothetical protein
MEGTRTGHEDLAHALEVRLQKKAGRRSTAISIRCTAEELPARIQDLEARGFEIDRDYEHQEYGDSHGPSQHIVVLHDPTKYDELISLPGISSETRCF